jgi:hypothetical protein
MKEQLRRLDAKLDELRREADQLDTTLEYLERRRDIVERAWVDLLKERDELEALSWQDAASFEPPRPPDLTDAGVPMPLDPVLESWGLDDVEAPTPQWIPPAHTWPMKIAVHTGMPPRRGNHDAVPSWLAPVDTAPIWHRACVPPPPRRRD